MPDTLSPAVVDAAPRHATRMQLRSASRLAQGRAHATAVEHAAEAFTAADDLVRALRKFQALRTDRKDEMRNWIADTLAGALDQLGNVEGAIDRDLDADGCSPLASLDLSEMTEFWEEVK